MAAPAIQHPKLQRLYDYWAAKCGARKMPARADIDPIDMAFIVGNVIMADVIPRSPLAFRIRLHGTTLSERVGYDLTGKMLDDMPVPEFRELSRRSFTKVATTGEPLHALAEPGWSTIECNITRRSSCRCRATEAWSTGCSSA